MQTTPVTRQTKPRPDSDCLKIKSATKYEWCSATLLRYHAAERISEEEEEFERGMNCVILATGKIIRGGTRFRFQKIEDLLM